MAGRIQIGEFRSKDLCLSAVFQSEHGGFTDGTVIGFAVQEGNPFGLVAVDCGLAQAEKISRLFVKDTRLPLVAIQAWCDRVREIGEVLDLTEEGVDKAYVYYMLHNDFDEFSYR